MLLEKAQNNTSKHIIMSKSSLRTGMKQDSLMLQI